MMSGKTVRFLLASLLAMAAAAASAEDWPNWRGPNHNGVSDERGFRTAFTEPNVLWRARIGIGYSGFAIAGGRAFTMGWADGNNVVYAFNAATGKLLWTHTAPCPRFKKFHPGGSGATPTVHNNRVFTLSKQGDLFCLDATSGEELWSKRIDRELGARTPSWGFSGSPVIDGDRLIIDLGVVAALNTETGKVVWKSDEKRAGYSTPVVFEHAEGRFIASFHGRGLSVLDAANGRRLADYRWKTSYDVNAGTPLIFGDKIFISSGYNKGAALLRFTGSDLVKVWSHKRAMRNQMNPSVPIGGAVYGFDGDAGKGVLTCLDAATGDVHWRHEGLGTGALISAAGMLIIISETGELVIAEATTDGYQQLAGGKIHGGTNWTEPALANGRVYCRNDAGDVACIELGLIQ